MRHKGLDSRGVLWSLWVYGATQARDDARKKMSKIYQKACSPLEEKARPRETATRRNLTHRSGLPAPLADMVDLHGSPRHVSTLAKSAKNKILLTRLFSPDSTCSGESQFQPSGLPTGPGTLSVLPDFAPFQNERKTSN